MRILLLGETGREPGYEAWNASLVNAGVPFDAIAAAEQSGPVTIISSAGALRYQALILIKEGLLDCLLDSEQRSALDGAERDAGLRRLSAYAYPGPQYGLNPPSWSGRLDDVIARLTPHGLEVFPYLRGPVPIDPGTWGYLATPEPGRCFEPLLLGPGGSSLLGVWCDGAGREQMVQTFDANSAQVHGQLLRQGMLAWLTRGVHVGYQRNYLTVHVDDVLLPNHGWDPERHVTGSGMLRMSAQDALRTARWSQTRGIRLDFACNGAGSERHARETGASRDPLLDALLSERDAFGWVNHTFEHQDLDGASQAAIENEIKRNLEWGAEHGIEFEPDVLITGEHTGLANLAARPPRDENPNLAPALNARGIRFLACDASRPYPSYGSGPDSRSVPAGTPFVSGGTLAVPRYPTALAHDVATADQLIDRLRHSGGATVGSWRQVVSAEARRIFAKALSNDPRPHFFHQSNLMAIVVDPDSVRSSLLCELLDAVLDLYHSLIEPSMPLVQPTLSEIGRYLLLHQAGRHAWASGSLEVYREGNAVTVVNRAGSPLELPLTGTLAGEDYGGTRSAWFQARPGTTVIESASPS